MDNEYNAYDYDRQQWVTGERAKTLLIKHTQEELTLLLSDKGTGYARMIGVERHMAINHSTKALQELTGCKDGVCTLDWHPIAKRA